MRQILSILCFACLLNSAFGASCPPNQYLDNNICTNCVYNATCDGENYTCIDGFYDNGKSCAACPPNSTCTSANDFTCVAGTYLYNGTCAKCVSNATCAGGAETFQCNDGWYRDADICRSCAGQICKDGKLDSCVAGYFLYTYNGVYCMQCDETQHCPAGTTIASVTCAEGYYKSGYHCFQCPDEYWCPDAVTTSYDYMQYCASGYYQNGGVCTQCPDGVVCPGHKLAKCPDGLFWHDDGRCLEYASGDPGIAPNCNPGFFDDGDKCVSCPVENSVCTTATDFDCLAGFYKNGAHCDVCPKYATCPAASTQINCWDGYYLGGNQCHLCWGANYCINNQIYPCPEYIDGSLDSVLPSGHRVVSVAAVHTWTPDSVMATPSACRIGKIVISAPEGDYIKNDSVWDGEKYWGYSKYWYKTDTAGRYLSTPVNIGNQLYYYHNNQCTNAPDNAFYTGAGSPDANDCPWQCNDGYMRDGDSCTVCPAGYTCIDGLLVCPIGQYADGMTCVDCPESYRDRADDNKAPQSVNQCQIKCNGGTYLASSNATTCTSVGTEYWNPVNYTNYGDTGIRNQCPDNMTTIGYGSGADEESDCGKVLHFGDYTLRLRSGNVARPRLAIQYGDRVLYGSMSTHPRGHLRTSLHGVVYSIFNADID